MVRCVNPIFRNAKYYFIEINGRPIRLTVARVPARSTMTHRRRMNHVTCTPGCNSASEYSLGKKQHLRVKKVLSPLESAHFSISIRDAQQISIFDGQ